MYTCSVCKETVSDDLAVYMEHTQDHIVDVIKKEHPEWVEEDGICRVCEEYFRRQMKGD